MRQSDNGPTYEYYCSTHDYSWSQGEDGDDGCPWVCCYCEAEFTGQSDHEDARAFGRWPE